MALTTIDPATGELQHTFPPHDAAEIERRLALAETAFQRGRQLSFAQRAAWMRRAADLLEGERDALADLMAREMGKPIRGGRDEVTKCAATCRFYAEKAPKFLADETVELEGTRRAVIRYEPLGPVLAIMPWNFPFWQVIRFAAPALMAGNVGLLKHASNVPQCALALEDLLRRAGFPEGAFQVLLVGGDAMEPIIADPRVRAVTVTGGENAGRQVAALAGREIKKTVLELGGSDPFIVLPSADLAAAVATAVKARTLNSGQSCIAAKRFILHAAIAETFTREMVRQMEALRVGDPRREETDVGPLATEAGRAELHRQVELAVTAGARLLTGGEICPGPGWFYPPTVLDRIPADAPIFREEFFGPVALLFTAPDAAAALALANDSRFGLGASVWTQDAAEADYFARGLDCGQVFVNEMVSSDPRLPFGAVKQSGYGRELGSHGMREFVNVKTVVAAN